MVLHHSVVLYQLAGAPPIIYVSYNSMRKVPEWVSVI